jgi:transposase
MSDVSESQQAAMWAEAEWEAREPELIPSEPEPERKPRLKPVNRNQLRLRTVEVEKLVEANHLVRAIWELVGRLDLKGFTAEIAAVDGVAGRSAFDPRLLISLWLYADSEGVGSAHEVERRCAYPPAYQGLTGMEAVNYHPSADGSDFRVQYQEALDELFAQRLGVLSSEGLISLERVVHDGTKVKASASGKSFHREKTLRAHLEAARERVRAMGDARQEESRRRTACAQERAAREKVEKLEEALQEMKKVQAAPAARAEKSERRVSESDPEARLMKQSDGGYAPSHNVQISTDTAHGIIVGASVTQAANDQEQRVPAMEEIERQTGRRPEHLVVDDGYTTRENVLAAAEKGVDLIGGMMEPDAEASPRRLKQRGVDPAFYAENFRDNPATNTYACPAGKALPYQTPKHDRVGVERKVYKARAADCRDCGFRPPCRPGAQGRRIVRSENVPVVA